MIIEIYERGILMLSKRAPFLHRLFIRWKTELKFVVSGTVAAIVDLGVLYVFTDFFGVWYLVSAIMAFIFAFFTSFFLQKYWTFEDGGNKAVKKQMVIYFVVAICNLALNTLLMYVFVDIIGVHYIFSQIIVALLIACASFFVYRNFIFKKVG